MLAGCDRAAPEAAQGEGALADDKASLVGEVDRRYAGELMPAETVYLPDGREFNLGALQGQPVLVNLWATWCAPCKKEMPLLDALAQEREGTLRVITVSQDKQGTSVVEPYFAAAKFALLEPWLDPQAKLLEHFGDGLPISILYDASGREVWRIEGDYDWDNASAAGIIDEGLR
ncbi:MAG: TlpA family protein disulfide reductase [Sphingomonadaceae bacterium]|nr:MAG: TlpA family protein disulfide reductase [Sphingomonadaceae bacterium]